MINIENSPKPIDFHRQTPSGKNVCACIGQECPNGLLTSCDDCPTEVLTEFRLGLLTKNTKK